MARPARVHVDGGIYHVIMRGNAREPIFFDGDDRHQLNRLIGEGLDRYDCRLHAFCWMTNHIHAAIQVADRPLSGFMCWTASQYARFVNRKLSRTGHLFERRHQTVLVRDDAYLLELVKYIHLNPVRAGLVASPERYPWSSHRGYLGTQNIEWLTTRGVLSCFAASIAVARERYREFMNQDQSWLPDQDRISCNGEEATLNSSELSMCIRRPTAEEDVVKRIAELVAKYCSSHDIDPAILSGPGRQRLAARARGVIGYQAITNGICTTNDLARYFGRAPEVVARGIKRYRTSG